MEVIIEPGRGGGGDESFRERNAHREDLGAEMFKRYCASRGYRLWRMGFDAKADPVSRFWELPPAIRFLPDFVIDANRRLFLVEVKGSPNLKTEEYETLAQRADWYGPSYVYAFCWRDEIAILRPEEVASRYEASPIHGRFPSDGKEYRTLNLGDRLRSIE